MSRHNDLDYVVFTDALKPAKRSLKPADVGSMSSAELHEARKFLVTLMSVIDGRLAVLEGVAASDGARDAGRPQDAPRDPLRGSDDPTLAGRVSEARSALNAASHAQPDGDVQARVDEVKRAMEGKS